MQQHFGGMNNSTVPCCSCPDGSGRPAATEQAMQHMGQLLHAAVWSGVQLSASWHLREEHLNRPWGPSRARMSTSVSPTPRPRMRPVCRTCSQASASLQHSPSSFRSNVRHECASQQTATPSPATHLEQNLNTLQGRHCCLGQPARCSSSQELLQSSHPIRRHHAASPWIPKANSSCLCMTV